MQKAADRADKICVILSQAVLIFGPCMNMDRNREHCVVSTVLFTLHNVYIVQFFSFPEDCHIIEHIYVPTRSVERNVEKSRFP